MMETIDAFCVGLMVGVTGFTVILGVIVAIDERRCGVRHKKGAKHGESTEREDLYE